MEFLEKLLWTIIFILLFCVVMFLILKNSFINILEEEKDLEKYNFVISKNYLTEMSKRYPEDKFYKETLEIFNQKEKEKYKFVNDEKFLEKVNLEKNLYDDYVKFKNE